VGAEIDNIIEFDDLAELPEDAPTGGCKRQRAPSGACERRRASLGR
jgi:hypothetical protein